MQGSLFAAVTGLRNHQIRMDVIGNNIANVNTTAFKSGRASFEESFSQVLQGATRPGTGTAGSNALEVGLGVQLGSIDTVFTQGNLETTGITTDLAVQGNSFFVTSKNGQPMFTRAGNFQVDANGTLTASNGAIVQGRMATGGVLGGSITNIVIPPNMTTPAKPTTTAGYFGNLDASAPTITAADPTAPTPAELADPANAASVMQTTVSVFDSVGNQHDLTLVAWKTGPSQWNYKIDSTGLKNDPTKPYTLGPGALSSPAAPAAAWQFTFKADGTLDTAASNMPNITFTPLGTGSPLNIKLDAGNGGTGLTSFSGATSAVLRNQDGYGAGVLTRTSIGKDGTITGTFSNGTNQTLGQIALADFNNPQGLETDGDNMYVASANSGPGVIGFSGRETSSTIASGALEMSNVDLAQQFTDMIITQRGFQANGKMITTSDQMLQDLVNMIR